MAFLTVFIVMHVALVFIVHRGHNTTHMVFGAYDPARVAQGTTFLVLGAVLVVAAWIAISYLSVIDARATQRFLFRLLEPIRAVTVNKMKSRTREVGTYTEADISPYHWSNGRHPTPEESPEWHALAANDFRDYVLEIGPSDHPLRVTFDQIKALPQQEQISMHTCMQGWTGIAKWKGPKVMTLMALGGKRPADTRYLLVTSFGTAQKMHGGRPLEPYYSCIPLADCLEDESMFAWSMNDRSLPWTFGAPLRLRVESIHGYKMVKYVRSVEWIVDFSTVGDGMGGTREDSGYQAINARI
jgi:DMSO/TMAO reductase YedYZ molybdopterin-dependent catalytic subunit